MSAPTFSEHMDRLARDGVPTLDSGADGTVDGPDVCGYCGGARFVDDGDRLCPECLGDGVS